jgi:hypothetical protein
MDMNRLQRIGIMGALALGLTSPAFACSILPPPPAPEPAPGTSEADAFALQVAWSQAHGLKYNQETRDWAMKQQVRLYDEAVSIVIARHVREDVTSGAPKEFDFMNGLRMAVVKPLRWVKGSGDLAEINVASPGMLPPCAQMTGHDAIYGKPGDVFLVYLTGGDQPGVMEAYSLERIIEPRTIEALTKTPE